MAINWAWIRNMKLRNKLAVIYTVTFTIMLGVTFIFIYSEVEQNRETEFLGRMKDKTNSTFNLVVRTGLVTKTMMRIVQKNTVNSMLDEEVVLFDSSFNVIYSTNPRIADYPAKLLAQMKSHKDLQVV